MNEYPSFAEYMERRERHAGLEGLARPIPALPGDDARCGRDPVAERSLYPLLGKAVNSARPVSPLNSRLLALPGRRKLKSQVMGRQR